MFRRLACILVLAAAPALTGCVASGGSGDELITARDAHDVAAERARLWDEHAELGLATLDEMANVTLASNETFVDDEIGNGRGVAWRLHYTSSNVTDQDLVIVVLQDRTIYGVIPVDTTAEAEVYGVTARYEEHTYPVRNWTIDSHDAALIAAQNATWKRLAPQASSAGFTLVGGPDADPVWLATLRSGGATDADNDDARDVHVYINATSGDVLPGRPAWFDERYETRIDFGVPPPPAERGRAEDVLTPTAPTVVHVFGLEQRGHDRLVLRLVADTPVPGSRVHVTLDRPFAAPRHINVTEPDATPGERIMLLNRPSAGTYELTVELTDGPAMRYRVCWLAASSDEIANEDAFTCGPLQVPSVPEMSTTPVDAVPDPGPTLGPKSVFTPSTLGHA